MATRISHIPFYDRLVIADKWLYLVGFTYLLPIPLLYSWKPLAAGMYAAFPLAILLVVHPPTAIAALIFASFLFALLTHPVVLLPADAMAILLVLSYLVDLFLKGGVKRRNSLARPYLFYLVVMLISLVLEDFTFLSVRYFARQLLLFGTFLAVAHFTPRLRVKNFLAVFIVAAICNSAISLTQFLGSGGQMRAFGIAGKGFGDHAMMAVLIAATLYVWSGDLRKRWLWGLATLICMGALVGTQTRASMITAAWGLITMILIAWKMSRQSGDKTPKKNILIAFCSFLLAVPVLFATTTIFEGVMYRFGRLGFQATGTILERFSLWKAAVAAFWDNPFFGIGTGNYPNVFNWVPEVRFDHIYYLVSGLSPHAVSMSALAETGIFGVLGLTVFYIIAIRTAHKNYVNAEDDNDIIVTQILFVITLVIVFSSIYAGSWFWGNNSYHMALFFGFVAGYHNRPVAPIGGGESG